jgi:hypothetical protein
MIPRASGSASSRESIGRVSCGPTMSGKTGPPRRPSRSGKAPGRRQSVARRRPPCPSWPAHSAAISPTAVALPDDFPGEACPCPYTQDSPGSVGAVHSWLRISWPAEDHPAPRSWRRRSRRAARSSSAAGAGLCAVSHAAQFGSCPIMTSAARMACRTLSSKGFVMALVNP